jgi:uncharacterized protein YegL
MISFWGQKLTTLFHKTEISTFIEQFEHMNESMSIKSRSEVTRQRQHIPQSTIFE